MARHNNASLYGQVLKTPRIITDENGKFVRGMCPINVIRGIRDFGNHINNLKYDCPIIMTGDPEKIAEMATWKLNDMVEVKGTITTKEVNKNTICPQCGHKNSVQGNVVFVNPIYLSARETDLTQEEGLALLKKRVEISNSVTVIGTLCRDVETYTNEKGLTITQYQLAINRKFRLRDDAAENRTDYPWVKSYGDIGEDDSKFLHMGSVVLIDGMIQTREVSRKSVCSECGEEYPWKDNALEIVPYSVEYLQNFITPEEYLKLEEEETQNAINKVFNA